MSTHNSSGSPATNFFGTTTPTPTSPSVNKAYSIAASTTTIVGDDQDTTQLMPRHTTPDFSQLAISAPLSAIDSLPLDMRTRSMAKKEATSQQQAAASQRVPSLSRTHVGSSARSQIEDDDNDDDDDDDNDDGSDDDDEDDGSDDDDEDDDDDPETLTPAQRRQLRVLDILSLFEPNQQSFSEFREPTSNAQPIASQRYRQLAEAISSLVRNEQDLQRLESVIQVPGDFWNERSVDQLENRVRSSLTEFATNPASNDAVTTLARIRAVYTTAGNMVRSFPTLPAAPILRLLSILVNALAEIILLNREIRVGQSVVYAGGQHEFNLYMRFASYRQEWAPFIDLLRTLTANAAAAAAYRDPIIRARLAATWTELRAHHRSGFPNGETRELTVRFGLFLQLIGIPVDSD